MNIQGVLGGPQIQVRQIQPGKLEEVKKATKGNDLDEVIVTNDKGSFLIMGENLELGGKYVDGEGQVHHTNLSSPHGMAPRVGDKVNFGDLKGKFEFMDDETDPRSVGSGIGGFIGGFAGFAVGASLMSDGSKLGDFLGIFLGGGPGAAIGALGGMAAGAGITHLIAKPKPDASGLEKHLMPADAVKAKVTDSPRI